MTVPVLTFFLFLFILELGEREREPVFYIYSTKSPIFARAVSGVLGRIHHLSSQLTFSICMAAASAETQCLGPWAGPALLLLQHVPAFCSRSALPLFLLQASLSFHNHPVSSRNFLEFSKF